MQYVYLIQCRMDGPARFYKIGVANDVEARLASLQTGNPFQLQIVDCYGFHNAEIVERALHQKYAGQRTRGEWFDVSNPTAFEQGFVDVCAILGGESKIPAEFTANSAMVEEAESIQETEDVLLAGITWRLERRNDRTPPGFAIFKRGGEKTYLGYVGQRCLADPEHPTVAEIEAVIAKKESEP